MSVEKWSDCGMPRGVIAFVSLFDAHRGRMARIFECECVAMGIKGKFS